MTDSKKNYQIIEVLEVKEWTAFNENTCIKYICNSTNY